MKILVVRLDGFVEVLLATPLIRCLHRQVNNAEIHVLTGADQGHLLRHNPYIFALHSWEEGGTNLRLQEESFDFFFDLQNDHRSRHLGKGLKPKAQMVIAPKRKTFFHFGLQKPWIDEYFKALAPQQIFNDGQGLNYFIPEEARVPVTDIPHSHHAGFLCIALSSSRSATKALLQMVCQQINYPVILVGGKKERILGEAITSVDAIKIYNACGKFSFDESADLVRQSKLLVTCNTEWMQIGAALQKEMVIIQEESSLTDAAPYYGKKFLQRSADPFDKVEIKNPWWRSTKNVVVVTEILDCINRRLRKK